MRHLLDKDKKNRLLVQKYEYLRLIYKAIIFNIKLPLNIREHLFNILLKYKKASKVKLRNRCVITYRSRYIITKYKISRLVFKRIVLLGKIMGVYKKTW